MIKAVLREDVHPDDIELGAYELQVQGCTIAKVSLFKECEPIKGPVYELPVYGLKEKPDV